MSAFKDTFTQAINKGLFDVTLDKRWEVPSAQFYMGDLASSIPSAANYNPETPINVSCKANRSGNIEFNNYDFEEAYVDVD